MTIEYSDDMDVHKFIGAINSLSNLSYFNMAGRAISFRGQADSQWRLEPALYRLVKNIPLEDALGLEFDSIQYFKQHARVFLQPQMIPENQEIGEWLALMQHHRAPTRMLDWTTSPNVALYFVVFDEPQYRKGALRFYWHKDFWPAMNKIQSMNKERWQALLSKKDNYIKFGCEEARDKIYGYDPDVKSERMMAQQSVFTFCERLFCDQAQVIGKVLMEVQLQKQEVCPLCQIVIGPLVKKKMRLYLLTFSYLKERAFNDR